MGLFDWLTREFEGEKHTPPRRSLAELAQVAERLVRLHLGKPQPLRRAAVAKKLASLSRNLNRAAKTASELGEDGVSQVLLASDANRAPEYDDALTVIGKLQDWAIWSTRAAETAQQMSRSHLDHKGGRTPDVHLRSLATVLMDRYESLLAIRATHVDDPETGLGHSTFDRFFKEAIRLHAPDGSHFEPTQIDGATERALPSRRSNFWS